MTTTERFARRIARAQATARAELEKMYGEGMVIPAEVKNRVNRTPLLNAINAGTASRVQKYIDSIRLPVIRRAVNQDPRNQAQRKAQQARGRALREIDRLRALGYEVPARYRENIEAGPVNRTAREQERYRRDASLTNVRDMAQTQITLSRKTLVFDNPEEAPLPHLTIGYREGLSQETLIRRLSEKILRDAKTQRDEQMEQQAKLGKPDFRPKEAYEQLGVYLKEMWGKSLPKDPSWLPTPEEFAERLQSLIEGKIPSQAPEQYYKLKLQDGDLYSWMISTLYGRNAVGYQLDTEHRKYLKEQMAERTKQSFLRNHPGISEADYDFLQSKVFGSLAWKHFRWTLGMKMLDSDQIISELVNTQGAKYTEREVINALIVVVDANPHTSILPYIDEVHDILKKQSASSLATRAQEIIRRKETRDED